MSEVRTVDNNIDSFSEAKSSKFTAKVFGYMGIGLAITAIISAILNFIFSKILPITGDLEVVNEEYFVIYIGILIGSLICLFGVSIWINITSIFKKGANCAVPFSIYAILMGVMMSALTIFVDAYLISITVGITTLTFGAMFLIGFFSKKDLSPLAIVGFGLLIGAFTIGIFNLIIYFFFPQISILISLAISCITFFAMMLFTVYDIRKVKDIAMSGMGNNNVALYCAFTLYVDFIYLFIRILRIVIILFGKKK